MSLSGRRVLVTGGAGYIGSHAVHALLDVGAKVSVIDNLSTGNRWAVAEAAEFFEGDVGNIAFVKMLMDKQGIQSVLHFAGSVVVPESVENPLKYYRNNTGNSRSLIEAVLDAGVGEIIFSSTAAVYGIPDVARVTESTPTQPINPYGASKLMTEWMLRDVAPVHPLAYAALRYFNVAGADPSGRTGQATPEATHLIKVACEAVLGKRKGISVFGTDYETRDGTGIRDYIHVSDLVDVHVATLEHLVAGKAKTLTMNCGYGAGYSVREVLSMVEKVAGQKLNVTDAPRRAGDPGELVSDVSTLKATLDWQPKYNDLEVIAKTALEWERSLDERRGS